MSCTSWRYTVVSLPHKTELGWLQKKRVASWTMVWGFQKKIIPPPNSVYTLFYLFYDIHKNGNMQIINFYKQSDYCVI